MSLLSRLKAEAKWGRMVRDAGPKAPADIAKRYPFASWAVCQASTLVDDWEADGRDLRHLRTDMAAWRVQVEDVKHYLERTGLTSVVADEMRAIDRTPTAIAKLLTTVLNLPFSDDEARAVWRLFSTAWTTKS